MDLRFKDIEVLIWDFDGTFYPPLPELWQDVREAEYRVIRDHLQVGREQAVSEFKKLYKQSTPSATETVALICSIPTAQAATEMERYYDRRRYLKRDEKLIALFQKLGRYRHFILANGVRHRLVETLVILGLKKEIFAEIVTSETVGANKPNPAGFRHILQQTPLAADKHLMVGDREQVDLAPAKELGMKTCLVWTEAKSGIADMTLAKVYDMEKLLL